MKLVKAGARFVLVEADGRINAPGSLYINDQTINPNTAANLAMSLRLFHSFCLLFEIRLLDRALEGMLMTEREINSLISLSFRPLADLDNPAAVKRCIDPRNAEMDEDRAGAVTGNTAAGRLNDIAGFLDFYLKLLAPHIRSPFEQDRLAAVYRQVCDRLKRSVGGAAASSPYDVRSMDSEAFLACIKEAYLRPEGLQGNARVNRAYLLRDRAMFMLGCEGLRPGEIANLRVNDIEVGSDGVMNVSVVSNRGHRQKVSPVASTSVPSQKGINSRKVSYCTERMIKVWPFTADALYEYIKDGGPRRQAIASGGRDASEGFVFLKSNGEPLKSRQAIGERFDAMCESLRKAGLMRVETAPGEPAGKKRGMSAYTLRHSAASHMYETEIRKRGLEAKRVVHDLMNARFGWSDGSAMALRYARRAILDAATTSVNALYEEARAEVDKQLRPTKGDKK
ncbi:tyrosine-type recombinase/integrase [Niveibacterium sp.]|uniref:tyrosine-type recombinase/integrase n=1 Tax=Niveibacterium sp. TaxID=2017444 RepID=UPI0035AE9FA8